MPGSMTRVKSIRSKQVNEVSREVLSFEKRDAQDVWFRIWISNRKFLSFITVPVSLRMSYEYWGKNIQRTKEKLN